MQLVGCQGNSLSLVHCQDEMKAVYEKEMLRLVKQLTGAYRVCTLQTTTGRTHTASARIQQLAAACAGQVYTNGHISRSEEPAQAGIERPSSHHIVHNDFTPNFRATLENGLDTIGPFLAGGGKVCIYNTWRYTCSHFSQMVHNVVAWS